MSDIDAQSHRIKNGLPGINPNDFVILSQLTGVSSSGVVSTRQVVAGSGIAGGGDLSQDRTFNIGTSDGTIVVAADTIRVGVITTANITTNAVDNTIIRDSVGTSVIGRSANTTGDPADIVATASGQFLRRDSSSILGFGAITTEDLPRSVTATSGVSISAGAGLTGGGNLTTNRTIDVVAADATVVVNPDSIQVGIIQNTNIRTSAATSVIGRSANTTGTPADIAATASGQFLRRDGAGTLGFGTILTSDLPAGIGGGGGITGFTPGSIVFIGAGGTPTEDHNNLNYDSVNKRVGKGTASPNIDFDVNRSANSIVGYSVINASAALSAKALFIASNGSTSFSVGITGTGFATGSGTPNLGGDQAFLVHPNTIYIGSDSGDITIQTGSPNQVGRFRVNNNGTITILSLAGGGVVNSTGGALNIRQSPGFSVLGKSTTGTGTTTDIGPAAQFTALTRQNGDVAFDKIAFSTIELIPSGTLIGNDGGNNEEIIVRSPLQILGNSGELTLNTTAARAALDIWDPYTFSWGGTMGIGDPAPDFWLGTGQVFNNHTGFTLRRSYTKCFMAINMTDTIFGGRNISFDLVSRSGHGGSPITLLSLGPFGGDSEDNTIDTSITVGNGDEIGIHVTGTATSGDSTNIFVTAWFQ